MALLRFNVDPFGRPSSSTFRWAVINANMPREICLVRALVMIKEVRNWPPKMTTFTMAHENREIN